MYVPAHFVETRPEELHRVIRENPLGALVTRVGDELDANHVPFELDASVGSHGRLTAHVARANPVWQAVPTGTSVLVIFRGAAGYVSPSWYPSKHEFHRQVPTWNYEVVHAHGVITIRDDEKFVRGVVARLTRKHEATEPTPWKIGESAPEYIDQMLQAIVGIEIDVQQLVGKFKLSQNKEARDRDGAVQSLRARDRLPLAHAMGKASDEIGKV